MSASPVSPSPEEYKIFVSKPLNSIAQYFQFDLDKILEYLFSQRSYIDQVMPVYSSVSEPIKNMVGASVFVISLDQDHVFCKFIDSKKWSYSESPDGRFLLSLNYKIPQSSEVTLVGRTIRDLVAGLDFFGDEKITSLDFPDEFSDDPGIVCIEPKWIEKKYP